MFQCVHVCKKVKDQRNQASSSIALLLSLFPLPSFLSKFFTETRDHKLDKLHRLHFEIYLSPAQLQGNRYILVIQIQVFMLHNKAFPRFSCGRLSISFTHCNDNLIFAVTLLLFLHCLCCFPFIFIKYLYSVALILSLVSFRIKLSLNNGEPWLHIHNSN